MNVNDRSIQLTFQPGFYWTRERGVRAAAAAMTLPRAILRAPTPVLCSSSSRLSAARKKGRCFLSRGRPIEHASCAGCSFFFSCCIVCLRSFELGRRFICCSSSPDCSLLSPCGYSRYAVCCRGCSVRARFRLGCSVM